MFLEQCSDRTQQVMVSKQIWTISMHSKYEFYVCRVCGAEQLDPPWGEDGKNATFDLCDCCGVEFGYEDATLMGIRRYREEWLSNGAKWKVEKEKPKDWLLEQQLKNVPKEYI